MVCIEMVHGAAGSTDAGRRYWSPEREGTDFELTYSLEPLAGVRKHLTIVSGCDVRQAEAFAPTEVGADHFRSSAAFLTGAHPKQTSGGDIRNGVSIDQIYARELEGQTRLPSIQLGIEHVDGSNSCAFDYHCIYSDALSWASETEPLLPVINPRTVFEMLFGDAGRSRGGGSVVDAVSPEASRLRGAVGAGDRRRVDAHLAEVREVERRIEAIEKRNAVAEERELQAAPLGTPDSWEEHVRLMFDLQALAFAADVTRVSSFKMSHDVSNRVFPESGVSDPFHTLSHHKQRPEELKKFATINRYHVRWVAYFLERLAAMEDGEGSLLDHTLALYGSPMGDSETHNHRRVPLFLAGGAGGRVKGNLHRVCAEGTPQTNVLLTMLRRLGVEEHGVGDSTGEVDI